MFYFKKFMLMLALILLVLASFAVIYLSLEADDPELHWVVIAVVATTQFLFFFGVPRYGSRKIRLLEGSAKLMMYFGLLCALIVGPWLIIIDLYDIPEHPFLLPIGIVVTLVGLALAAALMEGLAVAIALIKQETALNAGKRMLYSVTIAVVVVTWGIGGLAGPWFKLILGYFVFSLSLGLFTLFSPVLALAENAAKEIARLKRVDVASMAHIIDRRQTYTVNDYLKGSPFASAIAGGADRMSYEDRKLMAPMGAFLKILMSMILGNLVVVWFLKSLLSGHVSNASTSDQDQGS